MVLNRRDNSFHKGLVHQHFHGTIFCLMDLMEFDFRGSRLHSILLLSGKEGKNIRRKAHPLESGFFDEGCSLILHFSGIEFC